MSGGALSPDESLRASVVTWIGPGKTERQHRIYIGIGDKGDDVAARYFQTERSFVLSNSLEWDVVWLSNTQVAISIFECSEYKGVRQHPDSTCHSLDKLDLVRDAASAKFYEVRAASKDR